MKHLAFLLIAFFAVTVFAAPGVNFGDHLTVLDVEHVADLTASSTTTSSIDLQSYSGQLALVLDAHKVAGTNPTLNVKIQDSADDSSYADVSGAAFTQVTTADSVQKMVLSKDGLRRYIKAVIAIGGTSSPEYLVSVKGLAVKKYAQ